MLFTGGIGTTSFTDIVHNTFSNTASPAPHTSEAPATNPDTAAGFAIIAGLELTEHIAAPRTAYTAAGESIPAWLTHYGERFNGRKLGCSKLGYYSSDDPTIVAVSYEHADDMPCGTLLEVCGPTGCHLMVRKDTCPGCSGSVFDLSESGNALVCGESYGLCRATVTKVVACENFTLALPPPPTPDLTPPDEATRLSYLLSPELHAPTPQAPAAPVCAVGGAAP